MDEQIRNRRLFAFLTAFAPLLLLFQNCGPAKVSADAVENPDAPTVGIVINPATSFTSLKAVNGNCVDINHASTDNGAEVIHWTCTGDTNQLFGLQFSGKNLQYNIVAAQSRKCLSVANAAVTNAAPVEQRDCAPVAQQTWRLINVGNDSFKMQDMNSLKCLTVDPGGALPLYIYTCEAGLDGNQLFHF